MSWICKYCNNEFKTRKLMFEHYKECDEKAKLPKDSLGRVITEKQRIALQIACHHSHNGHKLSEKQRKRFLKVD